MSARGDEAPVLLPTLAASGAKQPPRRQCPFCRNVRSWGALQPVPSRRRTGSLTNSGNSLAKRKRTQIDGRRDLRRTTGYAVEKCAPLVQPAEFLTLPETVAILACGRGTRNRVRGSDAVPIAIYAHHLAREQRERQTQPNNSYQRMPQLICATRVSGFDALG